MQPDAFADDGMDGMDELEAELARAGGRARKRATTSMSKAAAADLRSRLIASYGDATSTTVRADAADAAQPAAAVTATVIAAAWGGSASSLARGAGDAARRPLPTGPVTTAPSRLRGRLAPRTPTVLPAPRWTFLAAAAAIVVAVAGLNGTLLRPVLSETRVNAAAGAQLVRGGSAEELVTGMALRAGDEIVVGADGSATLQLGDSIARLDGGADLTLVTLDRDRIAIDQASGRSWHRVVEPAGGHYTVTTGEVTWTALGTAFDLERSSGGGGPDVVRELSVQHDVVADGPGLKITVREGVRATVALGGAPTVSTEPVTRDAALAVPWLLRSARADVAAGFGVGFLEGAGLEPTAGPTAEPATPRPTAEPTPDGPSATPEPSASPTPAATPVPTPLPTPKPTPTPAPTLGIMSLTVLACPGGVVLDWTTPEMAALNHVQVLRGTSAEIPLTYPPSGGIVAVEGGYSSDPLKSDGFDPTVDGGGGWYRAVAYDLKNKAIAASDSRGVTTVGITDLGALGVTGSAPGELTLAWTAFTDSPDCFTYYKVVASMDDATPSYLEGATLLAALGDQTASGTVVGGLTSGQTLWLRVQVLRETSTGKFIAAQTTPTQFTVP